MPPVIASVTDGRLRPLWSVMIPTFNCANYLRETLAAVLAQDPGPDVMQIEVIDDCSTKDDPAAVVRELGAGRVAFYQQPANGGATANFNTCLQRSRGHLVHVLHGDDWPMVGFYQKFAATFERYPQLALCACRAIQFEDTGCLDLTPFVSEFARGTHDSSPLWYSNPLRTPAVVIRRSFYEQHGGFDPTFPHVADWEMWERGIRLGGGVQLNEPLAYYRLHPNNDTGRLAREGKDIEDYRRLQAHFEPRNPAYDSRKMRRSIADRALFQSLRFRVAGDAKASAANLVHWKICTTPSERFVVRLQAFLNRNFESLRTRFSRS